MRPGSLRLRHFFALQSANSRCCHHRTIFSGQAWPAVEAWTSTHMQVVGAERCAIQVCYTLEIWQTSRPALAERKRRIRWWSSTSQICAKSYLLPIMRSADLFSFFLRFQVLPQIQLLSGQPPLTFIYVRLLSLEKCTMWST